MTSETANTEVSRLPSSTTGPEIAARVAEHGAVIVDDLVDPSVMDDALSELRPHIEATPPGPDEFTGHATTRTGGLIARSETCRQLVMHPTVLSAVETFLEHATNHQLHLTQVISIGPGQRAQPIHRDQWAFDFFPFPDDYEVQLNTIWAMTDFTEANGATRLIPGSNTAADRMKYTQADTVPAEMRKGSVLVYSGRVYHGGGANTTDEIRRGINITYNVAWLRQEENQYLSTPPEIARELPDELLRLMGYATGAYALGYVDDLRSPLDVIRGTTGRTELGDLDSVTSRRR